MLKPKVLFLCTGNSCRTQMAEGFLREIAGEQFEAISAGAEITSALDPEAVAAMWELGIDISGHQPKKVDPLLRERVSYLVTLCDRQIERTCPIFPGAIWRLTWPIEDPSSARTPDEHRVLVRRARDEIRQRVAEFVEANT